MVNARTIFSAGLFLVCMALDYAATDFFSGGNIAAEGNAISAVWWELTGPLHHLDIVIEVSGAFVIAYIARQKSEFLALWWLNGLAFGHLFGFLTWLPYGVLDAFYSYIRSDQLLTATLSGLGMLLGAPFALAQIILLHSKRGLKSGVV